MADLDRKPKPGKQATARGRLRIGDDWNVWVANSHSSGDRDLKQATTMLLPSMAIKGSGSRG
ncbi:MAG: hypothetical protein PVSMB1_17800 [Gemmatimonadaceae bacterium]